MGFLRYLLTRVYQKNKKKGRYLLTWCQSFSIKVTANCHAQSMVGCYEGLDLVVGGGLIELVVSQVSHIPGLIF